MDILFFDKRPMFLIGLSILLGAYIATGSNALQAVILACIVVAGAVAGRTNIKYIVLAVLLGICFFAYAIFVQTSYDNAYSEYDGKKCEINCVVVSVDAKKADYTLVTVKPKGFFSKRIKVYLLANPYDLIQGDIISFSGILHKPLLSSNPGGYDTQKAMYCDGSAAYMFAEGDSIVLSNKLTFGSLFGLLRKSICDNCSKLLGEDRGGILAGMLIGDKTGLDPALKAGFRDSGLSHTMAVSGSHIAYILAPLVFIFSRSGVPRKKYYPVLLGVLLLFAMLTGFQPSVARAALTAGIMLAAGLLSRETDALNSLALSAVILIIINPFAIYDAGFILSYSCVLAILIFYKPMVSFTGNSPVSKMIALTIAVQAGVLPVTAKLFYSVQVFSVISNLLIFPVRAVLTISGWLMYLTSVIFMPLAKILSFPIGVLTDCVSSVAMLFGGSEISSINVPYIPAWLVGMYLVCVYLALTIRKFSLIPIAVIIISAASYLMFFAMPVNTYVFLDSGQADCFIIKTDRGRDIIIDTGKYALGNSISHFCGDYIDYIFLTHAHMDHIGGIEAIFDRFRVGTVFIPGCNGNEMGLVENLCQSYGVPTIKLTAGNTLKLDGYEIIVLNPYHKDYLSLNDTSLVLKLVHGNNSLLYCGDVEMTAEIDMLSEGCNLKADIFKVPHHGSGSSAFDEFYSAVSPELAVVSCGINCFGHPSGECLEFLADIPVYRTDLHGAIEIKAKKGGYKVKYAGH